MLERVNDFFGFLGPVTDILWEFPRNFEWYANIPVLGKFSLAILLLVGCGVFFTFWLGFVQIKYFKKSFQIL